MQILRHLFAGWHIKFPIVIIVALIPLLLTFYLATPTQAAGTVTDCSSPSGPNGFYTKLGGGGVVVFNCPFPGPTVITISGAGGIIPAGNTTIDGTNNGHRITLSGGGTNRLFHQWPTGGTLTLMHVTLRDGNSGAEDGGCLYNEASMVLIDVLVTHCNATSGAYGGGIFSGITTTLTLINSQVISNTAKAGGGIASAGSLTLVNTLVSDNLATIPTIVGGDGGGLFLAGTTVISRSQILNNQAIDRGGGIQQNVGRASLIESTVNGNVSKGTGGGISTLTSMILTDVTVNSNASETDGGGIWTDGPMTLTHVTLNANRAGPAPYYGLGGGIFNRDWVNLYDVTFSNNIADSGAGLFNGPSSINGFLQFVTFRDNWAADSGGGIFNNSGSFFAFTTTFSSNTAVKDGGALYVYGGAARVEIAFMNQNHAGRDGGGIYNKAYLALNGAWLSGNSAVRNGGGIINYDQASVFNTTLDGNLSDQFGGGFYNAAGPANLGNSTVSGNRATYFGGGVYASDGRVDLLNVTISNNSAQSGGGVVNTINGTLLLSNTILAYSPSGGNCTGAPLTWSSNSISGDVTCSLIGWPELPNPNGVDPKLTALGNFGGRYPVHMLKLGSPAIDGVVGHAAPLRDERDVPRPQGLGFDIGAVERRPTDSDLAPRLFLPLINR